MAEPEETNFVKTKQKILNAALDVLVQHGFQALTQTRVAEVAGVSQGNLTYHFPTRTDLLKAIVEESKERMTVIRAAELEAGTFSWSSLEDFMMSLPLSRTMPHLMLALTVAKNEDPTLAEWFVQADLSMRQNFRLMLAKFGYQTDETTLHFLRATIIGASLMHIQQNSEASEHVARTVMKAACGYLKQRVTALSADAILSE
jgi:AcrR family transcriptional regulator